MCTCAIESKHAAYPAHDFCIPCQASRPSPFAVFKSCAYPSQANLSKNGVGVGDDISVGAAPSRAFASLTSPIRCCPTQKAPSSPSPVLDKAPRERARSAFELAANPPLSVLLSAGPVAHTCARPVGDIGTMSFPMAASLSNGCIAFAPPIHALDLVCRSRSRPSSQSRCFRP